jgi:ATP-binding cassette subfamily F protein uup
LPGELRLLEAVEEVAKRVRLGDRELSAAQLAEVFGFTDKRIWTPVSDLSGGERRRLQLLRLLLSEPNVLLLDEPTNDLDIDTLNVLEDFLDGWPGTLVVVSHDRYFLERVCDSVWALLDDGQISMLPRGVDEYLERRAAALAAVPGPSPAAPDPSAADQREARKTVNRIDRQLTKLANRETELHAEIAEHAAANAGDYERLAELDARLRELTTEKEALEEEWLTAAAVLDE